MTKGSRMEDRKERWITGYAHCRICPHIWVAVVPIDGELSNLECPNCHNTSGEMTEEEA